MIIIVGEVSRHQGEFSVVLMSKLQDIINDLTLGCQTRDSATVSSSKFNHSALLALLVALVLHQGDSADLIFAIQQYYHWISWIDRIVNQDSKRFKNWKAIAADITIQSEQKLIEGFQFCHVSHYNSDIIDVKSYEEHVLIILQSTHSYKTRVARRETTSGN